jgi:hypothetical protein
MAKEKQVGFTLRVDEDKWAIFTAIAALKRTTAVEMLRDFIGEVNAKNENLINVKELERITKEKK